MLLGMEKPDSPSLWELLACPFYVRSAPWDGDIHVEFSPTTNNKERHRKEEPDERRNEKKPWENNSNCLDRGCTAKV